MKKRLSFGKFGVKKIKKKHLLDRIAKLEDLVDNLYAKVEFLVSTIKRQEERSPAVVDTYVTLPKIDPFDSILCPKCSSDTRKNPVCMSVDCPYSMKVTCNT